MFIVTILTEIHFRQSYRVVHTRTTFALLYQLTIHDNHPTNRWQLQPKLCCNLGPKVFFFGIPATHFFHAYRPQGSFSFPHHAMCRDWLSWNTRSSSKLYNPRMDKNAMLHLALFPYIMKDTQNRAVLTFKCLKQVHPWKPTITTNTKK